MKTLVCIPIVVGHEIVREAINQVINRENVTVILCNNGGDEHIKNLLLEYKDVQNVILWSRPQNVYVTRIWDDFIQYFLLLNEWDHIILLNSDLTLNKNWQEVCHARWEVDQEEILVPHLSDDKRKMFETVGTEVIPAEQIYDGIAGIFITLSLKQAFTVSPLPLDVRVWFSDNWIYSILVALGEKVVTPANLLAYHHHSTSVSNIPGIHDIIEEDKKTWAEVVQPQMIEKIKLLKQKV